MTLLDALKLVFVTRMQNYCGHMTLLFAYRQLLAIKTDVCEIFHK